MSSIGDARRRRFVGLTVVDEVESTLLLVDMSKERISRKVGGELAYLRGNVDG